MVYPIVYPITYRVSTILLVVQDFCAWGETSSWRLCSWSISMMNSGGMIQQKSSEIFDPGFSWLVKWLEMLPNLVMTNIAIENGSWTVGLYLFQMVIFQFDLCMFTRPGACMFTFRIHGWITFVSLSGFSPTVDYCWVRTAPFGGGIAFEPTLFCAHFLSKLKTEKNMKQLWTTIIKQGEHMPYIPVCCARSHVHLFFGQFGMLADDWKQLWGSMLELFSLSHHLRWYNQTRHQLLLLQSQLCWWSHVNSVHMFW